MRVKLVLKRILGTLTLSALISVQAFALDVGTAKSQGLVGETSSGYLAVVKPSAEAVELTNNINRQRKIYYQKIAEKNSISLEAVEVRAGQKAIEKTPAGEFINTGAGWQKK